MGPCPNAQLVINSRDRFVAYPNPVSPQTNPPLLSSQPYNNFLLNNPGQNIVQGSIDKIQVAEIRFPYDIPNVVEQFTDLFEIDYGVALPFTKTLLIQIPQGFYTGSELAAQIQSRINTEAAAESPPLTGADIPQLTYSEADNHFTFSNTSATIEFQVRDVSTATNYTNAQGGQLGKSLLNMMGFTPLQNNTSSLQEQTFLVGVGSSYAGGTAPLIFTDFIDIVSKSLCGNVYITDGSTQRTGFRKDLLARVYIADETSSQVGYVYDGGGNPIPSVVGCRPFVIHRQFKNAKMIPNNLLNSLNSVDIQLLMDNGQPLPNIGGAGSPGEYQAPRDFQITLNVFETDRQNTVNVPSSGFGNY